MKECIKKGRAQGFQEAIIRAIREIVKEFGIITDKAMEILKISKEEQSFYKKMLEQ